MFWLCIVKDVWKPKFVIKLSENNDIYIKWNGCANDNSNDTIIIIMINISKMKWFCGHFNLLIILQAIDKAVVRNVAVYAVFI